MAKKTKRAVAARRAKVKGKPKKALAARKAKLKRTPKKALAARRVKVRKKVVKPTAPAPMYPNFPPLGFGMGGAAPSLSTHGSGGGRDE
jgi:hypothetical protein